MFDRKHDDIVEELAKLLAELEQAGLVPQVPEKSRTEFLKSVATNLIANSGNNPEFILQQLQDPYNFVFKRQIFTFLMLQAAEKECSNPELSSEQRQQLMDGLKLILKPEHRLLTDEEKEQERLDALIEALMAKLLRKQEEVIASPSEENKAELQKHVDDLLAATIISMHGLDTRTGQRLSVITKIIGNAMGLLDTSTEDRNDPLDVLCRKNPNSHSPFNMRPHPPGTVGN